MYVHMFTQRLVDQLAGVKNIVNENTAKWKSFGYEF
jgi:hypothetical protein